MPFRSRLRRAFTRGSQDDPNLASKSKTKPDPNVYQPGEKMPPLKYRRPVDPAHKAHLESFSWAKSWKRRSRESLYSPMGSRLPSRQQSIASFRRRSRSLGRKSYAASSLRSPSSLRAPSRGRDDEDGVDSGVGASIAGDDRPELDIAEHSDEENDVLNVGLSRNNTEDPRRPRKTPSFNRGRASSLKSDTLRPINIKPIKISLSAAATAAATSPRDQPFSAEDLELALKKSNLEATKEESDRSGGPSPGTEVPPPQRPRERLIAFDDGK